MKTVRWAACLLVVGGVAAFSGCQYTGRWLTPSEYQEYNTLRNLNKDQANEISSLANDKVMLTQENDFLKTHSQTQEELLAALRQNLENMRSGVKNAGISGDVEPFTTPEGVGLRVKGDVLFASGEDKLKSRGETVLKEIVALVRDKPNMLAIRGFSDSAPIVRTRQLWKSNFDLSGHRALTVLDFLEKEGISAKRMHFEGFGQYSPVLDPNGKEDMAKSRRVEIILLNSNVNLSETLEKPAAKPKPAETVVPK